MQKIKVPATTANIGSGFDTLGMALDLYNEFEISEIESGVEVVNGSEIIDIPIEENLIYKGIITVLDYYKYEYKGFRIDVSGCNIPMSRGLGSSATCVVAGVIAGNQIVGNKMSLEDIINFCTQIEGHPDNVVPAIVGGMVISIEKNDKVSYSKVNVPQNLKFVAMIPEFKVSTADARKVLPSEYNNHDCVFNIARVAMLINAMNNSELENIRISLEDKIHQPYRKQLINNIDDIFEKCKELGSVGEFISGSGSTLITIVKNEEISFIDKMKNYLSSLKGNWRICELNVDLDGAKVI